MAGSRSPADSAKHSSYIFTEKYPDTAVEEGKKLYGSLRRAPQIVAVQFIICSDSNMPGCDRIQKTLDSKNFRAARRVSQTYDSCHPPFIGQGRFDHF